MLASIPRNGGSRRIPPGHAVDSKAYRGGKPMVLATEISEAISELWSRNDPREYSRVIARRLSISEARVDRILAGLYLERDRAAATLTEAARNGLAMAQEAGAEVWTERSA